jgi:hypothetical protein
VGEKHIVQRSTANIYKTQSSRGLTTAHRPTPQPSITNRSKPIMQTFSTSRTSSATPVNHLDAIFLPSREALAAPTPSSAQRVPILPDSWAFRSENVAEAPSRNPEVTIVAVDPFSVNPSSAMSKVANLDGVVLSFAQKKAAETERDMWKGLTI